MKRLHWLALPAACVLFACGTGPTEDETPAEKTNEEKICEDAAKSLGSVPATAVSFDVDCTVGTDDSAERYECTKLALHYELADGTVIDLSGLDQVGLSFEIDYEPGKDQATQLLVRLSAEQARLSDGFIPDVAFGFPYPLFTVGALAVGDVDSECRAADTCAQVDCMATSADAERGYSLATIAAGASIQVSSAGHEKGARFAFSAASLPLATAEREGMQAVCGDGLIHYAR